jgi:uncharacterized linocin/CFP29 family protein
MTCDPQVPWTDEQWARVNKVIQQEASRARVAGTFLPLFGPLAADTDFVRADRISYTEPQSVIAAALGQIQAANQQFNAAMAAAPPNFNDALAAQQRVAQARAIVDRQRIRIHDTDTIKLATLQVRVDVRGAQMADPEMTSALALFRRAANVLARLEDALVFDGLWASPLIGGGFLPRAGVAGLPNIWEILAGQTSEGVLAPLGSPTIQVNLPPAVPPPSLGDELVIGVSNAIGQLEGSGHFGPFAVVLDQAFFLAVQTPNYATLVLPQDRIMPFLGGGPLLRSSALPRRSGLVVALGGAPIELVVATDVSFQFLQVTPEPLFVFRVFEKMALRIKEAGATATLVHPDPAVWAISPNTGPVAGGIAVNIWGINFAGANQVSFGVVPVNLASPNVSNTMITVNLPPGGGAGPVPVTVTVAGANSAVTPVSQFTYF